MKTLSKILGFAVGLGMTIGTYVAHAQQGAYSDSYYKNSKGQYIEKKVKENKKLDKTRPWLKGADHDLGTDVKTSSENPFKFKSYNLFSDDETMDVYKVEGNSIYVTYRDSTVTSQTKGKEGELKWNCSYLFKPIPGIKKIEITDRDVNISNNDITTEQDYANQNFGRIWINKKTGKAIKEQPKNENEYLPYVYVRLEKSKLENYLNSINDSSKFKINKNGKTTLFIPYQTGTYTENTPNYNGAHPIIESSVGIFYPVLVEQNKENAVSKEGINLIPENRKDMPNNQYQGVDIYAPAKDSIPSANQDNQKFFPYTLRENDTWKNLAKRLLTSPDSLKKWNPEVETLIKGGKIKIKYPQ